MNKKKVNDWILPAKRVIEECGIAQNGKVDNTYRGYISSFGAAVVMGSLKSAVAFFADDGNAKEKRSQLLIAMYSVIKNKTPVSSVKPFQVFEYVCKNDNRHTKEDFINASIAIKLALNFFERVNDEKDEKGGED